MKIILAVLAAVGVLGVAGAKGADCTPAVSRGIVCIVNPVGHIQYDSNVQAMYARNVEVIVEQTNAACERKMQ